MSSLTIRNIFKNFGTVEVLKGIDIEAKTGEFVALVGPSGCGKSTLLAMIAGLETVSRGEIYIGDRLVNSVAPKDRDIAMVFQSYALYPTMTVRENMLFGMQSRGVPKAEQVAAIERVSSFLQIQALLNRKPGQLSGGQRQRVAIARALAAEPEVLLADEPVSMLDVSIRLGVLNLLRDLKEQFSLAVLYITHDIASARYFADETLVMYAGRLVEGGESETVTQSPAHPYTRLLIDSAPDPERIGSADRAELDEDDLGEPPSLVTPPTGCRFHPRCPHVMERCKTDLPPRFEVSEKQWAACWLYAGGEQA